MFILFYFDEKEEKNVIKQLSTTSSQTLNLSFEMVLERSIQRSMQPLATTRQLNRHI